MPCTTPDTPLPWQATMLRFFVVAGLWFLVALAYGYYSDVQVRKTAHNCRRSISTQDSGHYIGERCSVDGGDHGGVPQGSSGLIRIYDAKTGQLLAREFVPNPETAPEWTADKFIQLGYSNRGADGAVIYLPPSAWDRFKARLP